MRKLFVLLMLIALVLQVSGDLGTLTGLINYGSGIFGDVTITNLTVLGTYIGPGVSATDAVASISYTGAVRGAITFRGAGITQTNSVFNFGFLPYSFFISSSNDFRQAKIDFDNSSNDFRGAVNLSLAALPKAGGTLSNSVNPVISIISSGGDFALIVSNSFAMGQSGAARFYNNQNGGQIFQMFGKGVLKYQFNTYDGDTAWNQGFYMGSNSLYGVNHITPGGSNKSSLGTTDLPWSNTFTRKVTFGDGSIQTSATSSVNGIITTNYSAAPIPIQQDAGATCWIEHVSADYFILSASNSPTTLAVRDTSTNWLGGPMLIEIWAGTNTIAFDPVSIKNAGPSSSTSIVARANYSVVLMKLASTNRFNITQYP